MADIYDNILIFSCSGGYENLKFVESFVVEATEFRRRKNLSNDIFSRFCLNILFLQNPPLQCFYT